MQFTDEVARSGAAATKLDSIKELWLPAGRPRPRSKLEPCCCRKCFELALETGGFTAVTAHTRRSWSAHGVPQTQLQKDLQNKMETWSLRPAKHRTALMGPDGAAAHALCMWEGGWVSCCDRSRFRAPPVQVSGGSATLLRAFRATAPARATPGELACCHITKNHVNSLVAGCPTSELINCALSPTLTTES